MRFRFRLANILRLRRLTEERELARLMSVRAHDAIARKNEQTIQKLAADSRTLSVTHGETLYTASDLQFLQRCLATLNVAALEAKKEVIRAGAALAQQQQVFNQARRQSEILEALRDKEAAAYLLEETRQTQQRLDDAHQLIRSTKTGQASSIESAKLARSSYVREMRHCPDYRQSSEEL